MIHGTPGFINVRLAGCAHCSTDLRVKRSHKTLVRESWAPYVRAFHDREELGPRMLARISKRTGLKPEEQAFSADQARSVCGKASEPASASSSRASQLNCTVLRTFAKGRDDDLDGDSSRFGGRRQVGESVSNGR